MALITTTRLSEIIGVPVGRLAMWLNRGILSSERPRATPSEARLWNFSDAVRAGVLAQLVDDNLPLAEAADRTAAIVGVLAEAFNATQCDKPDPEWGKVKAIIFIRAKMRGETKAQKEYVRSVSEAAIHVTKLLEAGATRIHLYDAFFLYTDLLKAFYEAEMAEEQAEVKLAKADKVPA
jgi:MerR HTH family regulatory protein